jgi:MatE
LTVQNADLLVISSYLGPAEVGMYFAAAKTMSLVLFIPYAVASAMANRIAALDARGEQDGLRAAVADAANWIFWPSLLAGAAILAVGKTMLWLFDPQFQQAYPVMLILAVGLLLRAALGPADLVLNMLGQGAASARLLIFSALLSVASAPPWSPLLAWPGQRRQRALPSLPQRPAIARSPDAGSSSERRSGITLSSRGGLPGRLNLGTGASPRFAGFRRRGCGARTAGGRRPGRTPASASCCVPIAA